VLEYASKFKNESGKIDYKSLVEDINTFDYDMVINEELEVPRSYASVRSGLTDAIDY
jgi:hypothetical protein